MEGDAGVMHLLHRTLERLLLFNKVAWKFLYVLHKSVNQTLSVIMYHHFEYYRVIYL